MSEWSAESDLRGRAGLCKCSAVLSVG